MCVWEIVYMVTELLLYTSYYKEYLALVLCAGRMAKTWEKFPVFHRKLMKWEVQIHSKTKLLAWGCINRLGAAHGNAPKKGSGEHS